MLKTLLQATYSTAFPDMAEWYKNVNASDEYAYIDSFNNRTKYTLDIYLKMTLKYVEQQNSVRNKSIFS